MVTHKNEGQTLINIICFKIEKVKNSYKSRERVAMVKMVGWAMLLFQSLKP
jgi:hypothetical protein